MDELHYACIKFLVFEMIILFHGKIFENIVLDWACNFDSQMPEDFDWYCVGAWGKKKSSQKMTHSSRSTQFNIKMVVGILAKDMILDLKDKVATDHWSAQYT